MTSRDAGACDRPSRVSARRGLASTFVLAVVVLMATLALAGSGPALAAGAPALHMTWIDISGPGAATDAFRDAAPTVDGGFVAAGVAGDDGTGTAPAADLLVTKYSPDDGAADHKLWVSTYNGPAGLADAARAVATDLDGGVVACGYSTRAGSGTDWAVVKWDADGERQWERTIPADMAGGRAVADDVTCDGAGDVYVCGSSQTAAEASSLIVRRLDAGNGHTLWTGTYAGPGGSFNQGSKLALDDHLNAYVVGSGASARGDRDILLAKFATGGPGAARWVKRIDSGLRHDDEGVDLALQGGSLYVLGGMDVTPGTSRDAAVARYTTSGTKKWLRTWRRPRASVAEPTGLAVNGAGGVAVAGYVEIGTARHAFLVKWDKLGAQRWSKVSYPDASQKRTFLDVAGDAAGNLWVGGANVAADGNVDWLMSRYKANGVKLWMSQWDGPDGLADECAAVGLTVAGKPFGAGSSTLSLGSVDAAAAQYSR